MRVIKIIFLFLVLFLWSGSAFNQTVGRYTLSAFKLNNNDSLLVVGGQVLSGNTSNPEVWHGYLPLQYSELAIDQLNLTELTVYPNPAISKATIILGKHDKYQAKLYGIDGRLIRSFQFTGVTETVDLNNLVAGTYILEIQDVNGYKISAKLIKQ
ncbi:MAG: T9SS type A sorting domain-containing protein [Crocinitomicaceae bacterium]